MPFQMRVRTYTSLIKSLQTGLLLATGIAGYMSAQCPVLHWTTLASLAGSLFLAISGSTVLNMWYDRDLDSRMRRTRHRPLAAGLVSPVEAQSLGATLSFLGIAWALILDPLYALVVFAGWFFDVLVYTVWLKRRTCWSVVWGGIAGGMPILAGRTLGLGQLDWVGIVLSLAVLFWIPTHIMTYHMKYHDDYQAAGIPTFPAVYSFRFARTVLAVSSLIASLAMILAAVGVGMTWGYLRLLAVLSTGLLGLALISLWRPNERLNFGLFKFASLYMLTAMLLIVLFSI